ncbi:hypothetical protein N5079_31395 [Planotetraspora sp. A-T 1434]|uniref:hypothetical protein n=1 Tax=Planotetraspora sp. A-T 1434 TaxID=2979219 RepID=UPI0021C1CB8B|nr:hypothetical protein [Planotetraspora sp. A-T 1434]MCT9934723.1 hypothetical protein [Planotetraspora sp. A-T 1434]
MLHGDAASDPDLRAQLGKEAAASQRVASFCTAPVLAAVLDGPKPYIVSEYVEGPSLRRAVLDGRFLAVAAGRTVRVWDTTTGRATGARFGLADPDVYDEVDFGLKISPSSTENETSSTATRVPYVLRRFRTVMIAMPMTLGIGGSAGNAAEDPLGVHLAPPRSGVRAHCATHPSRSRLGA